MARTQSPELFPMEPILHYRTKELARQMAARFGGNVTTHERALYRARERGGLAPVAADRVAIALGTHPLLLWGAAWGWVEGEGVE